MKKYILYPVVALLLTTLFTACDKDDNSSSTELKFSEFEVISTARTAKISIRSPRVIENGTSQTVRSVGIRYHAVTSDEWINAAAAMTSEAEHYVINLDGLTPLTEYEYIAWATTDTGTKFAETARFTTQDTALEATFGDMRLVISASGMNMTVASVKISVDEQAAKSDRCGIEYRAKGASQWLSVTNTVADATNGFTIDIAAADLTYDTTYEARAWIEVGSKKAYSQRTVECFYEKSKFQDIMGSWRLAEWHGSTDLQFAVYLSISANSEFTLWQQLQTVEWQKFTGMLDFDGNTVTGTYSDSQAWSTSYSVVREGENMIWTGTTDATDRSVYVPATIPDELSTMQLSSTTRSAERFL